MENEECCGVNESSTEMASSRIQENLESSNDMIAREEQGSKDHPIDVLEPCVEVAKPVQVDGTSFGWKWVNTHKNQTIQLVGPILKQYEIGRASCRERVLVAV